MALRVKEEKRLVKPIESNEGGGRRRWNPFKRSLKDGNINGENDNPSKEPIKPIPLSHAKHTAIGSGLGTGVGIGLSWLIQLGLNKIVDPATLDTIKTAIFHLISLFPTLGGSFVGFFGGRILGKLKIEKAITSLILDINKGMNYADTLEGRMDAVVKGIYRLGFNSRIYLFDEDWMELECKAQSGFSEEEMKNLHSKPRWEKGLTFRVASGEVGEERKPIIMDLFRLDKLIREYSNASIENITSDEIKEIISELQNNGKQKDIEMLELLLKSNLETISDLWKRGIKMRVLFPIVTDGMRVGVVSAHAHRRVGGGVIEQLEVVVDRLSTTIGKVRAQGHENELDGLTKAYNYKYFMNKLEKEIQRAKTQEKYKLSLIMFDLDWFKKINDTYGHPVGDIVLEELVALLKEDIRNHLKERKDRLRDIVGRYGGEEFCIIVRSNENPLEMCERIRKLVEEKLASRVKERCKEAGYDVTGLDKITISIGVAPYRQGDKTDLISSADKALYEAKNNGRNRVYGYGEDGKLIPAEPFILARAIKFANEVGKTEFAKKCEEALNSNDILKMREVIEEYMGLKKELHKKP